MALALEVAPQGQVTLPESLRDKYGIVPGQQLKLMDLGGVFVISPSESMIDTLCDDLRTGLLAEGETVDELLDDLERRRKMHG